MPLFTALDDELENLPTGEQAELRALHHLSDDAPLRFIAAEQMMMPENQALLTQLEELLQNSIDATPMSTGWSASCR